MASETLYEITAQVRQFFQLLRSISDNQLEQVGINSSHRALLEFLYLNPPQSVPQIAKKKSVSRQHIQTIVNALLDRNLIELVDNPNHIRSSFIRLTKEGKVVFELIREKESALLKQVALNFSQDELNEVSRTISEIVERFTFTIDEDNQN